MRDPLVAKRYAGRADRSVFVHVGSEQYRLPHIERHSPDGFAWGYGGSGPADLALSILTDAIGRKRADDLYQPFKWKFIASLPIDEPWEINGAAIEAWIHDHELGLTEASL